MNDNIYFRPAIPLLISLICGILVGSGLAGYEIWAMAAAVACAGLCLRQIARKKNAGILPLLLFVFLGYLSVQPWVSPRLPANHILHYTDTHRWDITGRIADVPRKINHRTRFHHGPLRHGPIGELVLLAGVGCEIAKRPQVFGGKKGEAARFK